MDTATETPAALPIDVQLALAIQNILMMPDGMRTMLALTPVNGRMPGPAAVEGALIGTSQRWAADLIEQGEEVAMRVIQVGANS